MSELNLKKNEVIKGWAKYYLTAEVNSGFERLTAPAFSYGMSAILAKLYKEDEEEYKKALQRHLMFYNSEATWGSVIFGMTCALEEERAIMLQEGAGSEELEASADMISNLKVGLMGPLAGVGDPIFWGTVRPVFAALGAGIAMSGSLLGPLLFFFLCNLVRLATRYYGVAYGYRKGVDIVKDMGGGFLQKLTEGASILGLFVMGAVWNRCRIRVPECDSCMGNERSECCGRSASGTWLCGNHHGHWEKGAYPILYSWLCNVCLHRYEYDRNCGNCNLYCNSSITVYQQYRQYSRCR